MVRGGEKGTFRDGEKGMVGGGETGMARDSGVPSCSLSSSVFIRPPFLRAAVDKTAWCSVNMGAVLATTRVVASAPRHDELRLYTSFTSR